MKRPKLSHVGAGAGVAVWPFTNRRFALFSALRRVLRSPPPFEAAENIFFVTPNETKEVYDPPCPPCPTRADVAYS